MIGRECTCRSTERHQMNEVVYIAFISFLSQPSFQFTHTVQNFYIFLISTDNLNIFGFSPHICLYVAKLPNCTYIFHASSYLGLGPQPLILNPPHSFVVVLATITAEQMQAWMSRLDAPSIDSLIIINILLSNTGLSLLCRKVHST